MEEIRRRMMQDTNLYPDPRKINQDREKSIASSSTEVPVAKPRTARPIVISSDEDENPAPVKMPVPNPTPAPNTRPPNFPGSHPNPAPQMKMPVPTPIPAPAPRIAQPIHVPSSRDLYHQIPKPQNQAQAQAPTWETFTLPEEANLYDPRTSAAEAEKALRELVEASHNDKPEGDETIDMRLAIVDGFRDSVRLLPHQVLGRIWMGERESGKKMGGILADDMGLGKTIQTLTRIVDGRPTKSDKADGWAAGTLVVCPVSLVSQWASEIQKMAVNLKVIEHHGPSRAADPAKLKMAHVVVTSYSIVSSEHGTYLSNATDEAAKSKKGKASSSSDSDDGSDDDTSDSEKNFGKTVRKKKASKYGRTNKTGKDALFRVKWWRIVLDEAHNIKNRTTKAALACCALQGKYRWCLTGTPMQNSVEELFSLIKFLQIRPLNDWTTFNEQIAKPVKAGRQVRAMKRLHVVLKAIMLRRRKDHILNGKPIITLPERIVSVVKCEFDEDEKEFYNGLETRMKTEVDKLVELGEVKKSYTSVLTMLLRLRQACNHPSLVTKDVKADKDAIEPKAALSKGDDSDDEADELADMLGGLGVSGGKKCEVCQSVMPAGRTDTHCQECHKLTGLARRKSITRPGSNLPPDSAKIREILRLLRDIQENDGDGSGDGEGEKTIIFSQFTSMLDLIQPFLTEEGIKHVRYDGSMTKDKREMSLAKIRESPSTKVILISFKAGSTGLNLTACNNVILVDLWWNPALEEQAFDRAHRFGQKRDVNIYKLTIEDTVEDRILALQEKKRELTKAALSGDKMKNNKLGINDLMALFRSGGRDDEEYE